MQAAVRVISTLASAHLRHEWILTLCLVIALAAVIAPLLVLLGLKYGTIELMRDRLVEDPVFRELRPAQTREYPPAWFDAVAQWPGVGFLTPTVLPLSSMLYAMHPQTQQPLALDLIPTGAGDPLLLENGTAIPVDWECVLSHAAAQQLGVVAGEMLTVRVTRSRGGRVESADATLRVVGVLNPRAGSLPRIYTDLALVLDVEGYKEGYGAPQRGWPGQTPTPFPSFDGVLLLLPEPLSAIERTGLIINTGFARMEAQSPAQLAARLGVSLSDAWHGYALFVPGATVTHANIQAVAQKLRGKGAYLLPYVDTLSLQDAAGQALLLTGLSLHPLQAQALNLPATPWGALDVNALSVERLTQVLVPGLDNNEVIMVTAQGVEPVAFPLHSQPHPDLENDQWIVPIELLGLLRTATLRTVRYEAPPLGFVMERGGYRGFRLYAHSIDDVPALYEALHAQGIEVIAEVETIARIRTLDAGLQRLFWLIALLGISGGTAVLIASLYAAVERRRRDLGILRLNGLSRRAVFFFPVVQALWIALLGLLTSFAGYLALASLINYTFASDLAPGERFCTLPPAYMLIAAAGTLVLAILASLAAAWRTTRIDPAEVVREH